MGHLRIERSSAALSGRRQQPASLHPSSGRRRARFPDARASQPGSSRRLRPGSFIFHGGSRRTRIPALADPPDFESEPVRLPGSASMRGGQRTRIPATSHRPARFQRAAGPCRLYPPWRRAEHSKPTPGSAHSLAARPGSLAGSLSRAAATPTRARRVRMPSEGSSDGMAAHGRRSGPGITPRAPPRIRTANLFLLREAPLPSWARRA